MFTHTAVLRSAGFIMLLAGSTHAAAAVPTLTATGTFGAAPAYTSAVSPTYVSASTFNGKSFELSLGFLDVPAYVGPEEIDELPGNYVHVWTPGTIQYSLKVGGAQLLSGATTGFNWLEAINDITPNQALIDSLDPSEIIRPFIQAGSTYDNLLIDVSNIGLGCVDAGINGICDGGAGDVYEGITLSFEYLWDTANKNAITQLPGVPLAYPADFLTGGLGIVGVSVWHWDGTSGGDIFTHGGIASTSNIALVPEAETWAMMLAGLGLVGGMAMRRRRTGMTTSK